MATLVQRLKQITATNNDDFFNAETLLHYLNKSVNQVVSYCINKEKNGKNQIRAIDGLRTVAPDAAASEAGTVYGGIYKTYIDTPTGYLQHTFLNINDVTPLRQLNEQQLVKLAWGNIRPSVYEAYFYVNKSTASEFEIYTSMALSAIGDTVNIYYIAKPGAIDIDTTLLSTDANISDSMENAVLYGAAVMMVMQEGVTELKNNLEAFSAMYKQELELNAY